MGFDSTHQLDFSFFLHIASTKARMSKVFTKISLPGQGWLKQLGLAGHVCLSIWTLYEASMGFLTLWWLQSSWTSYIVAGFSQNEQVTKVKLEASSDLVLRVTQQHF